MIFIEQKRLHFFLKEIIWKYVMKGFIHSSVFLFCVLVDFLNIISFLDTSKDVNSLEKEVVLETSSKKV
ncbi:hypothetical protein RV06_GL000805 [Enterococcus haemoperoxidus]|nr:hypothetical protein RV06_GL000805 [Enterococcus haemoperoxidus]